MSTPRERLGGLVLPLREFLIDKLVKVEVLDLVFLTVFESNTAPIRDLIESDVFSRTNSLYESVVSQVGEPFRYIMTGDIEIDIDIPGDISPLSQLIENGKVEGPKYHLIFVRIHQFIPLIEFGAHRYYTVMCPLTQTWWCVLNSVKLIFLRLYFGVVGPSAQNSRILRKVGRVVQDADTVGSTGARNRVKRKPRGV